MGAPAAAPLAVLCSISAHLTGGVQIRMLARQRSRLFQQCREVLLVLLERSEGVDVNRVVRYRQQALVDEALATVLGLEREVGREHANALLVQRPNQRNEVAVAGD